MLAERGDLAALGKMRQRLRLDLPDALARDAERPADLLERLGIAVAVHAVAELDDLALTVRQALDRRPPGALGEAEMHLLRGLGVRARDESREDRLAFLA